MEETRKYISDPYHGIINHNKRMTLSELIAQLKEIENQGYGDYIVLTTENYDYEDFRDFPVAGIEAYIETDLETASENLSYKHHWVDPEDLKGCNMIHVGVVSGIF